MKYSNFEITKLLDGVIYAEVDVTSWWRTKRVQIFRPKISMYFRFLDSGDWIFGHQLDDLFEAYKAKKAWDKSA
ncbi:MAG: hypothetical protein ACRC7C_19755 [Beijerinckiaceae bacterium]